MADPTAADFDLMILYGRCDQCGAPRNASRVQEAEGITWTLVCNADITHTSAEMPRVWKTEGCDG